MKLVAGIDSSTQSCKIVVSDVETGKVLRSARRSHPKGTEVDPNAWWGALLGVIADVGGLDDVVAISVAAQQHGLVALDEAGQPVRNALLWNDTRSAAAGQKLITEFGPVILAKVTGSVPVASFTSTKLRWLRDAEPKNAARVAAIALPHDWLTWRLRGYGPRGESARGPVLEALTTDRSDASGTGYFNSRSNQYDLPMLNRIFGRVPMLPVVLAPDAHAGTGDAGIPGVRSGTVVAAGAGDNAAAALGLGAEPGDAVVSIGTSGTVFAVSATPTTDTAGTVAGFASASGEYLPLIATINAAQILDTTARLLGVEHDAFARLALRAAPGAGGLVLTPYFSGERTPNLPDATAGLSGMTLENSTRENLARASIEALICSLADGLDALKGQDVDVARLLLIGGAALNPAVQHVAGQIFEEQVSVPQPDEYVAIGAAAQAAWALEGRRPAWPVRVAATVNSDLHPAVRRQYAEAAHDVIERAATPSS